MNPQPEDYDAPAPPLSYLAIDSPYSVFERQKFTTFETICQPDIFAQNQPRFLKKINIATGMVMKITQTNA